MKFIHDGIEYWDDALINQKSREIYHSKESNLFFLQLYSSPELQMFTTRDDIRVVPCDSQLWKSQL